MSIATRWSSGLRSRGHRRVLALADPVELAAMAVDLCGKGDMVVCLGAGSITNWAQALPGQIAHILGTEPDLPTTEPAADVTVPFPLRRPSGEGGAA
ncbi:MAG: hypothetical protein ACMVO3_22145 [Thalassobaculum sp.]